MDRELSHLTDMQIKALDILSMDYGLTNRELTWWLDKKEREEGNVLTKYVKPLLEAGLVYQVKMKDEYPKKRLYINKSFETIMWLKNELANPVSGKIQQHQIAHHKEQTDYKKRDWALGGNTGDLPISEKHLEIRKNLGHCIHLYKWCNKTYDEMHALLLKGTVRPYFSLLPPCPSDDLKRIKSDEYFQEHSRIIWEDGAYNIKELKFEPL